MTVTETQLTDRIKKYVFDQRKRFLEICGDLVRIETPSNKPKRIIPAFDYMEDRFAEINYETLRVPGQETGGCLYAHPPRDERRNGKQLLVGHVDTVWPPGTLEDRPFEVENNRARGPGVFDMKAGLTQFLIALECLAELDLSPVMTPVVLVNSDEEIGSPESTRIIKRLSAAADRAMVFEPSQTPDGAIRSGRSYQSGRRSNT